MAKRRRDSGKAQKSKRRLRKRGEVAEPPGDKTHLITPRTGRKAKNEKVAPKIRIGPNLILTGPTDRDIIDMIKETDGESTMPEIPYGHSGEHKREDSLLSWKNGRRISGDHVPVYGRRQDERDVIDSVSAGSVKGWKNRCDVSEVSSGTMVEQLRLMEEKLHGAEERVSQLEAALDEKSKELDAAVSFMNVGEPISGADIIALADTFNDEVFQGAAYIAEGLGSSKHRHQKYQKRTARYKDEYEQALMSLGPHLLQDLMQEGKNYPGRSFLLQVALQVCMVTFGVNVLQCWSPDKDEHKVMDQMYQRILSKENQEVAGSWRSVTRRTQVSEPMNKKMDALSYTIIDILIAAGWWDREDDMSSFFAKFQGNIVRIVDSALKLREAIGTVAHIDIQPMTVPPESHFCPGIMTNYYGSNTEATKVSESDKVLATTSLGLEQKVNRLEGDLHGVVILKPRVVLRSSLLSFLESEQESR